MCVVCAHARTRGTFVCVRVYACVYDVSLVITIRSYLKSYFGHVHDDMCLYTAPVCSALVAV